MIDKDKIVYVYVYKMEPVVFQWGINGFGFGEITFSYNKEKEQWECQSETLGKEFVKTILCHFVDKCELTE